MAEAKRVSALRSRIDAGKAEPITDEEREIVADLRTYFESKFGTEMTGRPQRSRRRSA